MSENDAGNDATKKYLQKLLRRCRYCIENNYKYRNIRNVPRTFDLFKYLVSIEQFDDENMLRLTFYYNFIIEIKVNINNPEITSHNANRCATNVAKLLAYVKDCVFEAYADYSIPDDEDISEYFE